MNRSIGDPITIIEQRGTVTYRIGDEVRLLDGYFMWSINGRYLLARKVRGRRWWQLCSSDCVLIFDKKGDK